MLPGHRSTHLCRFRVRQVGKWRTRLQRGKDSGNWQSSSVPGSSSTGSTRIELGEAHDGGARAHLQDAPGRLGCERQAGDFARTAALRGVTFAGCTGLDQTPLVMRPTLKWPRSRLDPPHNKVDKINLWNFRPQAQGSGNFCLRFFGCVRAKTPRMTRDLWGLCTNDDVALTAPLRAR